jgi:hypothetical protein|nr:MAG TPA: hypothetical protein [Caudoviricetes sp.]
MERYKDTWTFPIIEVKIPKAYENKLDGIMNSLKKTAEENKVDMILSWK